MRVTKRVYSEKGSIVCSTLSIVREPRSKRFQREGSLLVKRGGGRQEHAMALDLPVVFTTIENISVAHARR